MLLTDKPNLLLKNRSKVEIFRMNNANKESLQFGLSIAGVDCAWQVRSKLAWKAFVIVETLIYTQSIVFIAFKQPGTRLPVAASKNLHKTSSLVYFDSAKLRLSVDYLLNLRII